MRAAERGGEESMETGEELDNAVRNEDGLPKIHAIALFAHDSLALQYMQSERLSGGGRSSRTL